MKVNKNNCSKYIRTSETYDYSLFVTPSHQRKQRDAGVKAIMKSVSEHGVISAVSCRESKKHYGKLETYDGQHTVQACKRLGVPVVYNIFKGVSNKGMIDINGKSRSWKMTDYLNYGVEDNIDSYVFLDNIYREENIPLTGLIIMYGGSYANAPFKDLTWKSLTVKRGNEILRYIKDFSKSYNIEHSRHARFIWGLCRVVDTGLYDHKRMMSQLSKCSQFMTKQPNPKSYSQNIEMVYNHGVSSKNKVQFVQ